MPKTLTDKKYKLRLLIYRQWKRKSSPEQTVQNINSLTGNIFTNSDQVRYWYSRFDKGNMDVFAPTYGLQLFSSNAQSIESIECKEKVDNLLGSLFHITETEHISSIFRQIVITHGRFMFLFNDKKGPKKSLTIYDMFRGLKRLNPFPLKTRDSNFAIIGDYLVILNGVFANVESLKFHLFQIDYNNLSVKKLDSDDTNELSTDYFEILPNQLDNQKFVVLKNNGFISCQLENDKIVTGDVKNIEEIEMEQVRFVGNKMQGFDYEEDNFVSSMKFWELNLETMEKREMSAPIDLGNDEFVILCYHPFGDYAHCWSKNSFYGFFDMENHHKRLLSFDTLTLKWTDVQIFAQDPRNIFIDENDVMTFRMGITYGYNTYYRVSLRKPDSLVNLTRLAALGEGKFYGNNKYLKAIKSLAIKL